MATKPKQKFRLKFFLISWLICGCLIGAFIVIRGAMGDNGDLTEQLLYKAGGGGIVWGALIGGLVENYFLRGPRQNTP